MNQLLSLVSLVVADYDDAITFYTEKLNFDLIEDTPLSDTKRWVRIKPRGSGSTCLLLAKATQEEQHSRVGNQTGGRVFLFLHTDNIERDYQHLIANGIEIVKPLQQEPYGRVAVFKDLYGNLWDLIEPSGNRNMP